MAGTPPSNIPPQKNNREILLSYLSHVSDQVSLKTETGFNYTQYQLDKINPNTDGSVLEKYFCPTDNLTRYDDAHPVIFPFGCNRSQKKAVSDALKNQVSIIEGPPGTGKTQTILNIIANLVLRGKSVAVVSNNNSATENVFEKLEEGGFGYLAAQLGSKANKKTFITAKQTPYPDFLNDLLDFHTLDNLRIDIERINYEILSIFESLERIATAKHELSLLELEKKYYDSTFSNTKSPLSFRRRKLTSKQVLRLWNELLDTAERHRILGILLFKLKCILFHGIKGFRITQADIRDIVHFFQDSFYTIKHDELVREINHLEAHVPSKETLLKEMQDKSIMLFRAFLAQRYQCRITREKFSEKDLEQNQEEFISEYPVILSTTHSIKETLRGYIYDYVIVDEASQVDVITGVLAMSCARNIVVVGDSKQLPNVIPSAEKKIIANLSEEYQITDQYRYEKHSLLTSASAVFSSAPKTLLREHYRCHPKIIEFCNQKFYNGELLIMTKDHGEEDVLKAVITTPGNHARNHHNQRQIDEIVETILPELASNNLGIIAPYNEQTAALRKEIAGVDISTVHKFQGREKDDIIISTVDNVISEFTDDPQILNVAVSRAKSRLRVVISDNELNERTNIGDLIRYIQHENGEVEQGNVSSVFDLLYSCYAKERAEFLKGKKQVSEYTSENLMYAKIEEVLSQDEFSRCGVLIHQPLSQLLRDKNLLLPEEAWYAENPLTHVDFLIYNKFNKKPVLAVEVDGYSYHTVNKRQKERDVRKDVILHKYSIPLIRFSTIGSREAERLEEKLREVLAR